MSGRGRGRKRKSTSVEVLPTVQKHTRPRRTASSTQTRAVATPSLPTDNQTTCTRPRRTASSTQGKAAVTPSLPTDSQSKCTRPQRTASSTRTRAVTTPSVPTDNQSTCTRPRRTASSTQGKAVVTPSLPTDSQSKCTRPRRTTSSTRTRAVTTPSVPTDNRSTCTRPRRTASSTRIRAEDTLSLPTDNQASTSRSSDRLQQTPEASTRTTTVTDCPNATVVGDVTAGRDVNIEIQSGRVQMIQRRTNSRIEAWTRDMVDTSALSKLMAKLNSGVTWVTVKGQPGEGKTTATYMALKKLQQSGREVFQVLTPDEFTEVTTTCHHPVVMLDDILGDLDFDQAKWSSWKTVIDDILGERQHTSHGKTSKNNEVTVILVGRNYVLNNVSSDIGKIDRYFTDSNHVVFMSKSRERTISEKVNILKAICDSKNYKLDEETIDTICYSDGPHGFPHTCRLFVTLRLEGVVIDTTKFMKSPLEFLNQTVMKFLDASLKLLLFKEMIKRDGKISLRELHSLDNSHAIIKLVKSLLDSYLRKEDDCYSFHHPSIYDSVSFNLLEYDPLFVLESCSLSFLHERVRLEPSRDPQQATTTSESNLVVNIPRTYITDLAKRFAAAIENRELMLVLSHKALTDQLFTEELMCCITLPLTELLTLTDKQTDKSFLSLVASNKSPQLLKYIDKQTDIQLTEGDINTVLYGVCKYAASDVLTYLVQSRDTLDINVRYDYGQTPLMIASETKDSQFVQQLMSLGPSLKATDTGMYTVLHYLCQSGLKAAVEEVIDRGEDINVEDGEGWYPLYRACEYNQVEVARLLLNRGARLDARTVVGACSVGSLDLVELMFEFGATVNMTSDYTPLTAASRWGHVKVMRFLIDKGASVNTADESGRSPLHSACGVNNPQAAQWLLDHGAEINSGVRGEGNTSLHIAAGEGYTDIVDMLVNGEAIIDSTNIQGQTPLHTAVYYTSFCTLYLPDISVCQTLISHGAVVNKQDTEGNTPLHLLCQVDSRTRIYKDSYKTASVYKDLYRSLVKLFVDHGADREIQNNIGTLALHGWCKTLTD